MQVIVWKSLREERRQVLLRSRLLAVYGTWQREGEVKNLIAGRWKTCRRCWGAWRTLRSAGTFLKCATPPQTASLSQESTALPPSRRPR